MLFYASSTKNYSVDQSNSVDICTLLHIPIIYILNQSAFTLM